MSLADLINEASQSGDFSRLIAAIQSPDRHMGGGGAGQRPPGQSPSGGGGGGGGGGGEGNGGGTGSGGGTGTGSGHCAGFRCLNGATISWSAARGRCVCSDGSMPVNPGSGGGGVVPRGTVVHPPTLRRPQPRVVPFRPTYHACPAGQIWSESAGKCVVDTSGGGGGGGGGGGNGGGGGTAFPGAPVSSLHFPLWVYTGPTDAGIKTAPGPAMEGQTVPNWKELHSAGEIAGDVHPDPTTGLCPDGSSPVNGICPQGTNPSDCVGLLCDNGAKPTWDGSRCKCADGSVPHHGGGGGGGGGTGAGGGPGRGGGATCYDGAGNVIPCDQGQGGGSGGSGGPGGSDECFGVCNDGGRPYWDSNQQACLCAGGGQPHQGGGANLNAGTPRAVGARGSAVTGGTTGGATVAGSTSEASTVPTDPGIGDLPSYFSNVDPNVQRNASGSAGNFAGSGANVNSIADANNLLASYGIRLSWGSDQNLGQTLMGTGPDGQTIPLPKASWMFEFLTKYGLPREAIEVLTRASSIGQRAYSLGLDPSTSTFQQVNDAYAASRGFGSDSAMRASGSATAAALASAPRNQFGQMATGFDANGNPTYGWSGGGGAGGGFGSTTPGSGASSSTPSTDTSGAGFGAAPPPTGSSAPRVVPRDTTTAPGASASFLPSPGAGMGTQNNSEKDKGGFGSLLDELAKQWGSGGGGSGDGFYTP